MVAEINGKQVGFKINNKSIELLSTIKGVDTAGSFGTALIYCAYRGWCYWKQADETLTFGDIVDWVDQSIDNPEINEKVKEFTDEFLVSPYWKKVMQKKSELAKEAA